MTIKLYSKFRNSAGERVRIALALKGIHYEYIPVGTNGKISWDDYREFNPQGLMPTLSVGNKSFPQATAILAYLEEAYPEPALLPEDPVLRAEARAFAQYIASEMHAIDVIRVRRFLHNQLKIDLDGIARWQSHWSEHGFKALEKTLERRQVRWEFCFGENPGWADIHLVPQVRKAVWRFGLSMQEYPLVFEIYQRCIDLPAFVAASPSHQADYEGGVSEPALKQS